MKSHLFFTDTSAILATKAEIFPVVIDPSGLVCFFVCCCCCCCFFLGGGLVVVLLFFLFFFLFNVFVSVVSKKGLK